VALTKKLLNGGASKQEIAQIFNVKEGRAYYMVKNVSSLSLDTLVIKLNELLDIDYKSKVGLIKLDTALLTWIIK
jgi:DNA polymerase III delta subunit